MKDIPKHILGMGIVRIMKQLNLSKSELPGAGRGNTGYIGNNKNN